MARSLAPVFLLAMPQMNDPNFQRRVVLLCRHNDEGALGSVDNHDALYRQMSLLKAMGVNAFRTSHNPPSPELLDVCQRLGIVMMVEAFDTWNVQLFGGKLPYDYHLYFDQWSDYDITEMVAEDQMRANGYIVEVDQPGIGRLPMVATPLTFSATPVSVRRHAPGRRHRHRHLPASTAGAGLCHGRMGVRARRDLLGHGPLRRGGPVDSARASMTVNE